MKMKMMIYKMDMEYDKQENRNRMLKQIGEWCDWYDSIEGDKRGMDVRVYMYKEGNDAMAKQKVYDHFFKGQQMSYGTYWPDYAVRQDKTVIELQMEDGEVDAIEIEVGNGRLYSARLVDRQMKTINSNEDEFNVDIELEFKTDKYTRNEG